MYGMDVLGIKVAHVARNSVSGGTVPALELREVQRRGRSDSTRKAQVQHQGCSDVAGRCVRLGVLDCAEVTEDAGSGTVWRWHVRQGPHTSGHGLVAGVCQVVVGEPQGTGLPGAEAACR